METIVIISTLLMLVFGVYAVMDRSILRSAIGLALASACLSVAFYAMGAHFASVFELSVCSGLVTVIFISGISLSHSPKVELQNEYKDKERNKFLPLLLIIIGAALVVLALTLGLTPQTIQPVDSAKFRDIFWNTRQADVFGQIAAILCGGVAVAVLFREEVRKDK